MGHWKSELPQVLIQDMVPASGGLFQVMGASVQPAYLVLFPLHLIALGLSQ